MTCGHDVRHLYYAKISLSCNGNLRTTTGSGPVTTGLIVVVLGTIGERAVGLIQGH